MARASRRFLSNRSAAPSLRQLTPSGSLIRCPSVQVCHHHFLLSVRAKVPRVVSVPTSMALKLLLVVSYFVLEGRDPSTMSSHSFFKCWLKARLSAFRHPALRSSWRYCRMFSSSSDVVAPLSLRPLFHCYILGASVVSSGASVV
jgi:hypothetical protein